MVFNFNPFPNDKILDQTKLKAFADNKLNVTKMTISVFDRVENIVGKGEIACTSNFSFSHKVFKRLLSQTHQKVSLVLEWVNPLKGRLFLYKPLKTNSHTMTPFDAPVGNKPFENLVGKGKISHNEQFLLFPQCFLPIWVTFCHFR